MSQTDVLSTTGSMRRDEAELAAEKQVKNRRPPNTAFRQQRLKAWQPILTPKTVLPLFFAIGIIMAPLGGVMLWASDSVQELVIDYTNCATQAPFGREVAFDDIASSSVTSDFSSQNSTNPPKWRTYNMSVTYGTRTPPYQVNTQVCNLQFEIPNDIGPPVYLYYVLTKFYQNHRRYVKSSDQNQLAGDYVANNTINGGLCDPLELNGTGFAYYPCGLIANSLFNDTIMTPVLVNPPGGSGNQTYNMTNQGIAWSSDASLYGQTAYKNNEVAPPPFWHMKYPDGYNDDFPIPNLNTWEEFQVWMRTAGLPTFSKLALRNDNETMTGPGTYQMEIYDYFPAHLYSGTKSIMISTRTVLGGKNDFLGIAYIVVGGVCVILGAVFTVLTLIKPRKLGDHTYLTWNNDQPSTATTTGRAARPNEP